MWSTVSVDDDDGDDDGGRGRKKPKPAPTSALAALLLTDAAQLVAGFTGGGVLPAAAASRDMNRAVSALRPHATRHLVPAQFNALCRRDDLANHVRSLAIARPESPQSQAIHVFGRAFPALEHLSDHMGGYAMFRSGCAFPVLRVLRAVAHGNRIEPWAACARRERSVTTVELFTERNPDPWPVLASAFRHGLVRVVLGAEDLGPNTPSAGFSMAWLRSLLEIQTVREVAIFGLVTVTAADAGHVALLDAWIERGNQISISVIDDKYGALGATRARIGDPLRVARLPPGYTPVAESVLGLIDEAEREAAPMAVDNDW